MDLLLTLVSAALIASAIRLTVPILLTPLGTLFALIHAVVSITFRVNQIISGVTINLLAAGLARFLNILFFKVSTQSPLVQSIPPVIPVALLVVLLGQWVLRRTRFGLRLRAVGEHPLAADTLGVNVYLMRYLGVLISGALAGMAGGDLAIEQGRGYLEWITHGPCF